MKNTDRDSHPALCAIVCPLDWGIGHATRCVPVIKILMDEGYRVVIAGDGRSSDFLRTEFPGCEFVRMPGRTITYSRGNSLVIKMMMTIPGMALQFFSDQKKLGYVVKKYQATLVISDNRFGCRSRAVPSVFITHQLAIKLPHALRWLERLVRRLNYAVIRRYTECWIPDFEPHHGLAGDLSHPEKLPVNAHYIGILSRFRPLIRLGLDQSVPSLDILVMLSGPEPQRTILERIILVQLEKVGVVAAVVRGIPQNGATHRTEGNIHIFDHLDTAELYELMGRAAMVICRSGYSSLMDLVTVGKKAILIPTPGQPEQEYLASYLMKKKVYFSMTQDNFDLLYAMEMSYNYHGMVIRDNEVNLRERIRAFSG